MKQSWSLKRRERSSETNSASYDSEVKSLFPLQRKNIKNTFLRHIAYDKISLVYFGNEKMYADLGGKYG